MYKRQEPEKSLPDFMIYMLFFMKFLSGPIERASDMLPLSLIHILPKVQTVYAPGPYNTAYSDYEKQTGGFYQRTLNVQSYKSLRSTTLSFGPKYDGSEVLYWDGKMRPTTFLSIASSSIISSSL